MSKIVETLREEADGPSEPKYISGKTLRQAADRIEELEAALKDLVCIAEDEGIIGDYTTLETAQATLKDVLVRDK